MSFSAEVKNELCNAKRGCSFCTGAELYGMLLFGDAVSQDSLTFVTECREAADLFVMDTIELTGAIMTIHEPDLRDRTHRPLYTVTLEDMGGILRIIQQFHPFDEELHMNLLPKTCCKNAFLRGAYLACGTMSNPSKEYHLEFRAPNLRLASILCGILEQSGLHFKISLRGGDPVVYVKESEAIEDTLARLGAPNQSMELMNRKIEKEVRNNANRITNCETANIEKTVNASLAQILKIKKIKDSVGLESLPIPLQEAALLRLANPDATLSQLCMLAGGSVSRSGLNHRLNRLCKLADEL